MALQTWTPLATVLLLAVGLAGCGDDTPSSPEGGQATQESASPVDGEDSDRSSVADTLNDDVTPTEEAGAGEGSTASSEAASKPAVDVQADAETLGESPAGRLEEQTALPGEMTREDVDAIIKETEQRFEEASRRVDEQFRQAELRDPAGALEEDADAASSALESALEPVEPASLEDPSSALDERAEAEVEAVIKRTEERFEEARRAIDEQFEQAERETSGREGETTEPESGTP